MTHDPQSHPSHGPHPWWQGAVIYQIYPRSFSDANGDGVGDLKGITSRLDYIQSLGVDMIWLSPFFVSPMKDFGYDISNACDVDPIFGTLADFDVLLERAHQRGLKVIIDQVYSHTSDLHPWFQASRQNAQNPMADWYVWADPKPDGGPPNNWQSVFGGPAWTWDARRHQYYLHNFLREQPDLNVHNPRVQAEIEAIARFWLDRGVDGFRLDAINFALHDQALRDNPPKAAQKGKRTRSYDYQDHLYNQSQPGMGDVLSKIRQVLDSYGHPTFTVGEVGGDQAITEMKAYTENNQRLNTAYGFDFLYSDHLDPQLIQDVMNIWPDHQGEGWPSWAFSNHDAPRVLSRWGQSATDPKAYAKLCLMLLMALRGNIFLYQGEELGLPQADVPFERLKDPEAIANWPETLGRDGARTPMPWVADQPHGGFSPVEPWLPVPPAHQVLAVDQQDKDPDSPLALTRRLIALRRDTPALKLGSLEILTATSTLLVFVRRHADQSVLCVFNLSDTEVTFSPPPGAKVLSLSGTFKDSILYAYGAMLLGL